MLDVEGANEFTIPIFRHNVYTVVDRIIGLEQREAIGKLDRYLSSFRSRRQEEEENYRSERDSGKTSPALVFIGRIARRQIHLGGRGVLQLQHLPLGKTDSVGRDT